MLILKAIKISMKKINNEYIIIFISVILCAVFYNNHSNLITDFGREVMIPSEILNGQILYKDILNIYGALSYYINAFAMLTLGKNLNALFIMGSINCIIFSLCFYKLALHFLNKQLSLYSTLFVAIYCMYGFGLYNYQHPYAYAIVYGLTFALISILFLIKYFEDKKTKNLFISSIFVGMSVCCKIEFLPLIFFDLFVLIVYKKIKIKEFLFYLLFFLIPFSIYLIPIIQGLNIEDIKNAISITINESKSPSVVYFYKLTGSYFSLEELIKSAVCTTVSFSIFGILYIIFKKFYNKKLILALLTIPFFILCLLLFFGREFGILPIIILSTLIVLFIKKAENKYLILFGSALICSSKTIFSLNLTGYGTYTLPLLLLAIIVLFNIKNDLIKENFTKILIILLIIVKLIPVILIYPEYNYPLKTSKGTIKTSEYWAQGINLYTQFVDKNTNSSDKILHLQEGVLLNFLSDRKTDMNCYFLNLPYIETYGVKKIINNLNKFDYITIINGFGSYYFGKGNYYLEKNEITDFINKNFKTVFTYKKGDDIIILMKKIS